MENTVKELYDKASITKDIANRKTIITEYQRYGYLNRDRAIELILFLRLKDETMFALTLPTLSPGSSLIDATDESLIAELQTQTVYLVGKLKKIEER